MFRYFAGSYINSHYDIYKNNKIILLVDNARTHSARKYDKSLLFKKSGTNCPYDCLEWEENGMKRKLSFFFDDEKKKATGYFMCAKSYI